MARSGVITVMSDDWLAALYDEHARALYAFLLHLAQSEHDAQDVLQGLFCALAAKPKTLAGVKNVRSFLLRMAHRRLIDMWRRNRRLEPLEAAPTEIFAPVEDPDAAAFRDAASRALAALPAEQRSVVHLKLWENLTFAECAEVLGIPANTAASRYRYGLDKIRDLLRPTLEEWK